jgi:uncharacterized protein
MRFQREAILAALPEEVWSLVEDIPALADCIPGLVSFDIHDDRHFSSVVSIRVGPVQPRFRLETELTDLDPPRALTVITEGVDPALGSRVRQRQSVTLTRVVDQTRVTIDLEIQISGRIATFGQRVIASKAEEFASEVIANVNEKLAARRSTAQSDVVI